MKTVIIYSGGMDSTVALYQQVKENGAENVFAVSFNYGSKHNDAEYERAKATTEKLGVEHIRIDMLFISELFDSDLLKSGGDIPEGHYADESMKRTVVPFRNGIMLSIAAGIAESKGCDQVVIGNHHGDHAIYPDCREGFILHMSKAMALGTYNETKVLSPFCHLRKEDIAQIGQQLGVDWQLTYSCYKGKEDHCGVCGTCTERIEAFKIAGIEDPTTYTEL